MLEEHIRRIQNKRPEAGDYDILKEEINGGIDFEKMTWRDGEI